MTLDLEKFIANSIKMQAKIQHFDISAKAVKDPPQSVKKIILDEYGEKYLDDADYVAFFWGHITKDDIDKLFNVVDKALGKSANKLTVTDFKKIKIGNDEDEEPAEEETEEPAEEEEEVSSEEEDVSTPNDDAEEEQLDEDDAFDAPAVPIAHFFLKITLK